jgi:GT2 family glycosyltransferase
MKYSEMELKNKLPLQQLMLLIKFFIGLFPNKVKVMMRKNLWLLNLYSKNLQRSGLFYGFPSPEKLQKNYLKNIQQQTQTIAKLISKTSTEFKLNIVIVLSGEIQIDVKCVNVMRGMCDVQTVFLAGNVKNVKAVWSILENKHDIQSIVGEVSGGQIDALPLFLLKAGDYLHRDAINVFMQALQKSDSNKLILYSDKDSLDAQCGRHKGEFLPDWNPDLQLSCGYINTGVLVSGAKNLKEFWYFAQKHPKPTLVSLWFASIYLNKLEVDIEHIPLTLVHQSVEYDFDWLTAIQDLNDNSFAVRKGSNKRVAQLQWNQQRLPLVSLIIPTKNAKVLVQTCIESIFSKTDYANFEILLIDNESDDPEALRYFSSLRSNPKISVLSYPHGFNYSAINNFAVKYAKGEVIGLINNDIEVISPTWLTTMVGHAIRSDIGCVGAKLLYPDDRIQHAGVVLGYGGGAGHAHKCFPRYHPGYQNRLIASHNFSAVTAACLLVKKADYLAVGGFNDKDLTVAFNDVDFCLRVLQLGRRNLYCAEAVLYHHESISRGLDDTHAKRARFAKELQYLQTNWQSYITHDPAYNPNLTLRHENFSIKQ